MPKFNQKERKKSRMNNFKQAQNKKMKMEIIGKPITQPSNSMGLTGNKVSRVRAKILGATLGQTMQTQ